MRLQPLGESAWIATPDPRTPPYRWARALERANLPGVVEIAPAFATVGIYVDPDRFELAALETALSQDPPEDDGVFAQHTIPVCYAMGEDLVEVAARLDLSPEAVGREHAAGTYRCLAIGFCPGFPYLGPLPEPLRGVPRRPSPRVRVEPGSVAVTENQTGVYPLARPGGWAIVGRTPLSLVDVKDGYFPIRAGDEVRFRAIDTDEFHRLEGERL